MHEERRSRQGERARRLKAEGMCVTCGHRPVQTGTRGGRNHCDICRVRQAERKRAWAIQAGYHRPLKAAYTDEQRDTFRARVTERNRTLKALGMCQACAKRKATTGPKGGTSACTECREKRARSLATQQRARKAKRDAIRAKAHTR